MARNPKPRPESDGRMRRMLDALHGPALGKKESKRVTDEMTARYRGEIEEQDAWCDEADEFINPLAEAFAREHGEEVKSSRGKLEALARRIPTVKLADTPVFEPAVLPGSIIAIFAPPYDAGDQQVKGKNLAHGHADTGELFVRCQQIGGGSGMATAQIGKWFRPVASGVVRFRTTVHFSFSASSSTTMATVANSGFVGTFIFQHTDGVNRVIIDHRLPLWRVNSGWYASNRSGMRDTHESFDQPFFATPRSAYFLGVWCGCHVRVKEVLWGFGAATGEFKGRVPLIVVKSGT